MFGKRGREHTKNYLLRKKCRSDPLKPAPSPKILSPSDAVDTKSCLNLEKRLHSAPYEKNVSTKQTPQKEKNRISGPHEDRGRKRRAQPSPLQKEKETLRLVINGSGSRTSGVGFAYHHFQIKARRDDQSNMISFLLNRLISFYQKALSPFIGARCRYIPSCSEYMQQAIESRGVLPGIAIGLKRICRCAPWGGSGLDPYEETR